MRLRAGTAVSFVAVVALAPACERELSLENRPCPCAAGYTCCELTKLCVERQATCVFDVTPSALHLRLGGNQQFEASVPVTWSVDEPNGGSIDAAGQYHAPQRPGTYHVRARTSGGGTASTSVIVGPSELTHFVGVKGGTGNADGVGRDARFWYPTSIVGNDEYLYVSDGAGDGWQISNAAECAKQCSAASDPASCVLPYERRVVSGSGVRRISLSTQEVHWLAKDRWLRPLALDGGTLFAGTSNPTAGVFLDPIAADCGCGFQEPDGARAVARIDAESGEISALAGIDDAGPVRDGVGSEARFGAIHGMVAQSGAIYVTDGSALRQVDVVSGKVTTLAAGPSWTGETLASAPFVSLGAVALDNARLYAVDDLKTMQQAGQAYTLQSVWRYDLKTGALTELHAGIKTWTTSFGSLPLFRALCVHGVDMEAIRGNCIVGNAQAGVMDCSIGAEEPGSDDGPQARFLAPQGIWCGGNADYVTDTGNATIRRLAGEQAETLAGETAHSGPETVGPGPYMRLPKPSAITADSAGNVIVLQYPAGNENLVLVDPDLKVATYDLHNLLEERNPLAMDGHGTLYAAATDGGIFRLDLAKSFGQTMSKAAGSWLTSVDGAGGLADLVYDGAGMLYATVWGPDDCRVLGIDATTGANETVLSGYCGPLAVDGPKQLFVARPGSSLEAADDLLYRVELATHKVRPLATPADGWDANAIAYDPAGVLYVAEANRQRVRGLVVETGEVFDVVGKLGSVGVQLGALPASLSSPIDITLLPNGALAIADYNENVVVVAQ